MATIKLCKKKKIFFKVGKEITVVPSVEHFLGFPSRLLLYSQFFPHGCSRPVCRILDLASFHEHRSMLCILSNLQ